MSRVRALLCSLLLAAGAGLGGATAPAAAAAPPTNWACFPGQSPDPCAAPLTTTVLSSTTLQPRKVKAVVEPARDPAPAVDCFYVYPTVVTSLASNAPRHLTREVEAILDYQAAPLSQHCRMFAPVYRQATLAGIAAGVGQKPTADPEPSPAFRLAYRDVLNAWNDYLAHDNHGRGVVLIGHSQGSAMLIRLMQEQIDPDPAERALLVSAIVPGGNLTVLKGQRTGGDLANIPTCAAGDETGCVLAWSSYASRPGRSSLFGRVDSTLRSSGGLPVKPGTQVVCTNPAELSGDGGELKTLTATAHFPGLIGASLSLLYYGLPPKASTPYVTPGERYRARCSDGGGANVLHISPASPTTIVPFQAPWPDWGLHLADLNLPMGNLQEIVARQAAAWAAAHPAT